MDYRLNIKLLITVFGFLTPLFPLVSTEVCDNGTFGEGCLNHCNCFNSASCARITGECPMQKCAPGWKDLNCSVACQDGFFGQDCQSPCQCLQDPSCDHIYGSCRSKLCKPGWRGNNCSIPCDANTFGQNCSFACHCNNDVQCDHINGTCPSNDCDVGWTGNNCSRDENLIRRISATATNSPQWKTWTADNAIDFIDTPLPETCNCCFGSSGRPAWWRIDFGASYPIETIIFIGRNDGSADYQSRNFSIYNGFNVTNSKQALIYKNKATSGHRFVINFNPPQILKDVQVDSPTELTICEIRFIESQRCPPSFFGKHCTERCFCSDNQSCERLTGVCQHPGCFPGWQGDSCNNSCDLDFYGAGCSSQCHCLNNASCDPVSGNCSNGACAVGWQGLPTCNKECDWGSFGNSCAQHCHCYQNASCHNENGTCFNGACAPGFKTHSCSQVCDWGSFGPNCSNHCHCYKNASCDNVNGTCSNGACAAGWQGFSCSDKCATGMFGHNCNSSCHCLYNNSCHHIEGYCSSGHCAPGWRERNCSVECGSGKFGDNCSAQCHCINDNECNHVNGICPSESCAPGWRYNNCSAVCVSGKFGDGCMSDCHCFGGSPCHHKDGSCTPDLCAPGWWGHNCSIECINNTFGQNCNSSCHCNDCHHITGSCETLACFSSWKGAYCNVSADSQREQVDEADSTIDVILGPVLAAIVLLVIGIVIVLWRKRMRANGRNGMDRYKHGHASAKNDGLELDHSYKNYKNTTFDENEHTYDDLYHDISDIGETEGIAIKQLWHHVQSLYQNDSEKLLEEFESHVKLLNARESKASQVQIALTEGVTGQRYNYDANYIDGYDKSQKYIAAKGPLNKTETNAFWEMVYQTNVSLVIMLNGTHGKAQCMQYWAAEGEVMYGNITIKTVKFTTDTDFVTRQFEVSKPKQQRRNVTQKQFNGSLASGIHSDLNSFVQFWRTSINYADDGPILVHGSDEGGVGLYLALDILYTQANAERYVNPREVIRQICSQRSNQLQTKDQYGHLYELLAEALHIRARPVSAKDFPSFLSALRAEDPFNRRAGLTLQYEALFGSDPEYSELQERRAEHEYLSLSGTNKKANSNAPAVPDRPRTQPQLIHLPNHANQNAYILTSVDTPTDALWRVIENKKIRTVIDLGTDSMHFSMDESNPDVKLYSVRSMDTQQEVGYIINTHAYKRKNEIDADVKSVKQFQFLEWKSEHDLPQNVTSVVTFIKAIHKCQPEITEESPVLLINRSNLNKLGAFYIIMCECQRLRQTGEVNILETTLRLHERHANLTPTFEAYQFCHSVMMDMISDNDNYANLEIS